MGHKIVLNTGPHSETERAAALQRLITREVEAERAREYRGAVAEWEHNRGGR